MDLTLDQFAASVGTSGPVTIAGLATRGGPVVGIRAVAAPAGIVEVHPEEMTVRCRAGTPVEELQAALAVHRQRVDLPAGGTVGGALAVGRSDHRRLRYGPLRDAVLQVRYVDAAGRSVKAGGPTVKNVSGFDLCRLLVGSRGTLGFLGEVILRTRPLPAHAAWFRSERDPWELLVALARPSSLLWDGAASWVLLEGHRHDVRQEATALGLSEAEGPPDLPTAHRWSVPPAELRTALGDAGGRFVAEVGVGVVHHTEPPPPRPVDPVLARLHEQLKAQFDPGGRLNPGVSVLPVGPWAST